MATTTKTEWHRNIGSIWQRMVALWTAYVPDETLTWTAANATTPGFINIQITITGPVDETVYVLIDGGQSNTNETPVDVVMGYPGWRSMPPVVETTYGARNSGDDFYNNMHLIRRQLWALRTAADLDDDVYDILETDGFEGIQDIRYYLAKDTRAFALDWSVVTHKVGSADTNYYAGIPESDGTAAAGLVVAPSGGGGGGDMSGIVAALQDLLNRDTMLQLNNGAVTVLGWSGDVIEAP